MAKRKFSSSGRVQERAFRKMDAKREKKEAARIKQRAEKLADQQRRESKKDITKQKLVDILSTNQMDALELLEELFSYFNKIKNSDKHINSLENFIKN